MMLKGSHSSAAIGWVREDLDDCLETVRENLEAFAEDTSRREPLVSVQEELEQLNLTFLTMEQHGAGILTDEMIAVGGHMLHNGNTNCDESLMALTDAVIVLPSYLDRLQAGHEDLPILLLPTLNELRATYDESLLSEGTLFAPQLDVIIPELSGSEADAIAKSDFAAFAGRIRSQYQGALLGWLKEQSKDALLGPMKEVCRTLYIRLGRNELRRLWWIAELAMQGLRDGSIDNDLPLRRLFARLDLTLKAMIEDGEFGPPTETITALSCALLFYAAQARPGSKATDILRERFKLEELIPDRDALLRARGAVTGRDAGLFQSIGEAVREELSQVKDTLDMELRTGRVDAEQRGQSKTSLRQLADTLNMLNLPVPAKAVEDLLPALEETDGVTNMDLDSPLLALAQKLLEVEAILATHIELLGEPVEDQARRGFISLPPNELNQILSQLLDECVTNLHEAQEAIRKRLDDDNEADYCKPLEQISGALSMAGLKEVAILTDKLERTLNAGLVNAGEGVANLEALTDAVAALELYLAGCRDGQGSSLRFLEIMQSRLIGLPEASAGGEEVPETKISLSGTSKAPSKQQASTADTPDIDPAMLGIFLDEYDSVRIQIREALESWLANSGDSKAFTELRRGFHTLKGSGRMVGALEMGDFSWRIEELLNKLIENRITYSEPISETVRLAVHALDDMRSRLLGEETELDEAAIKRLSTFARMLANGNQPDLFKLQSDLPDSLLNRTLEEPAVKPEPKPKPASATKAASTKTSETGIKLDSIVPVSGMDPTLKQLMEGEIRGYINELEGFVNGLIAGKNRAVTPALIRAMHTLAGTFAMAPLGQEADVARSLERYLENRLENDRKVTAGATGAIQHCLHRFHQRLHVLQDGNPTSYPLDDSVLIAQLAALAALEDSGTIKTDAEKPAVVSKPAAPLPGIPGPQDQAEAAAEDSSRITIEEGSIISIFLEEAVEVLERCDTLLNTWRDKLSDHKLVQNLQREIHTFKGGARMAGLEGLGNLSHAMETLLEHIASNRQEATVAAVQALEEGCDCLNIWVEQLQSGRMPQTGEALARFEKKVNALHLPPSDEAAEPRNQRSTARRAGGQ